jgi:hypothetical protein
MNNKTDYSNTVIYKIICNDENINDVYVGSTTNFKTRKLNHKYNCNNEKCIKYNYNIYKFIRANGGWYNFSMILVVNFPCNNSSEAHERERYHYDILNCTMNTNVPNRTRKEYKKEYVEENKEKNKEYIKKYREENKDKIKEQRRLYRLKNKEKNKEKLREQKLNT